MAKKKSTFVQEFKEFISRGNVMDMAVGIIIGTAFTAIVTSLVNDVIMPFVGFIIGGINFTQLKWVIAPASETAVEVAIGYGSLLQSVINFLIIAFVVFTMVKALNIFRRKKDKEKVEETAPEAEISPELQVLTEIRDLLQHADNRQE